MFLSFAAESIMTKSFIPVKVQCLFWCKKLNWFDNFSDKFTGDFIYEHVEFFFHELKLSWFSFISDFSILIDKYDMDCL